MTRTARKGDVSAQFFRVDGADQETGEETYLVLQAPTKPQAEKLARQQGLLISAVRVARPDDWSAPAPPQRNFEPEPQLQLDPAPASAAEPEPTSEFQDPADSIAGPSPFVEIAPTDAAPQPLEPAPALPAPAAPAAHGSSAGAIFLGSIGAALIVGGVLALALALWPDNAVRNSLEQIDYRLHEVSQTILGGMLVLGGLVIFALAVICNLFAKRGAAA